VRLAVDEGHTDRWGRGLATLYVGGRDVGPTLIREGLAVAYSGKGRRIDWCAKLRG
jgi:endonuclease YncB( thermonuclease family)